VQKVSENIWVNSEVKVEVDAFITEWSSDSSEISAHTSGSTGKPKEISLSKSGLLFSAKNTIHYFNLSENTNALLCLPLSTIGGKMMLVRAIESKMKLFVIQASSNPLFEFTKSVDFIAITPMQLTNMMLDTMDKVRAIQHVLVGGAPMNEKLVSWLKEEKITVYHGYGMTETASHVALKKVGFQTDEYYQAMPGIHFEYGENQTLRIHYPALRSEPFETTDIVELIDSYRFKWLGRNDFVVNSGGVKIHVEEIENELSKLVETPFFVYGIPDSYLGEKLILCIESSVSKVSFDFDYLGVKKPREVFFLNSFVYTKSGKIDRKATFNQLNFKG
jgi:O-succinylbenzoic acid--CoA ligase